MAGFYEGKRDGTVLSLLKKYGFALKIIETSGAVFNEETGGITTAGTTKQYAAQGLKGDYVTKDKTGSAVKSGDLQLYIAASGLSVVPTTSHRVAIGSDVYEIVSVKAIDPGNITVLYELFVRK